MCVFLTLRLNKAQIKKQYDSRGVDDNYFGPVYVQSAFSHSLWPVITQEQPDYISTYNWGLIPHWIKDEPSAYKIRSSTVNAMMETIEEKPSFRKGIRYQRCVIPADGFFEYREVNKIKYPYFVQLKEGKPFLIAGIYDNWNNINTGEVYTGFSLVTTEANNLMARVHNRKKRMPVILNVDQASDWLEHRSELAYFGTPFPSGEMEAWTVSRLLSSRTQNPNVPEVTNKQIYPELGLLDALNI